MASACVNNIGLSPENFPPAKFPAYGWLSPRVSFSREATNNADPSSSSSEKPVDPPPEKPDPELFSGDFEFRLEDPVTMLPADELFSDGKLVPLHTEWRPWGEEEEEEEEEEEMRERDMCFFILFMRVFLTLHI